MKVFMEKSEDKAECKMPESGPIKLQILPRILSRIPKYIAGSTDQM